MKSFGDWFSKQGTEEVKIKVEGTVTIYLDDEPDDGVYMLNGKAMATCRSCHNSYEIYCDRKEFNPDMSYCGGSYRCVP